MRKLALLLAVSLALSSLPSVAFAGPAAVDARIQTLFGAPVNVGTPSNGQALVYESATNLWKSGAAITSTNFDTLFGSTQGAVIYRNAATWVALGPGTSGQFLKTLGAGANPTWSDASTASPPLSTVLATGNTTGANNILVTTGQLIQFGGATSSFVGIQRDGANGILESVLADGSAGSKLGATEVWFGGPGAYDVGIKRISGGKIQITDTGTTDKDLQAANVTLSGATGLTLTNAPGADTPLVTADGTNSGGSFTFVWFGAAGSRDVGIYRSTTNVLKVTDTGATNYAILGSGGIRLQAAGAIGFSSTSDATAVADTKITRNGSGAGINVGSGTQAQGGTVFPYRVSMSSGLAGCQYAQGTGSTQTHTTGTDWIFASFDGTVTDGGASSSGTVRFLEVKPTVNFTGSTKTDAYEGIYLGVTETSPGTGTNYLLRLQAGASGTTDELTVTNGGTLSCTSIVNASIDASASSNTPTLKLNETVSSPGNPTGTSSATDVMAGLAVSFTPRTTGRVLVIASCNAANNTAGKDSQVGLRFGTSTAPTNGAAVTGTQIGSNTVVFSSTAGGSVSATVAGLKTGLTPGTTYWFDLTQSAPLGGTTTVTAISYIVVEL